MAVKDGFKTVDTNLEEIDEKIRQHRLGILKRMLIVAIVFVVVVVLLNLWMETRSYTSYDIRSSVERNGSEAAKFQEFLGNIIEYSNDGITCKNSGNELVWNQSFEMNSPVLDICENFLVIYDQGGLQIYIMSVDGLVKNIETVKPIQTVCVANQGTIAVLMEENGISYVKLYDKSGKELANGQFYAEQGGYPVDIALSYDAKKLAIDMIDVNEGNIKSTITFYNFGSVGQNEIDNNVGSFSYDDVFIPEIEYISESRMVAFGENKFLVFEGSQKPKQTGEITFEQQIRSVFHNEKYIGVTYENKSEESSYHIKVFDYKGSTVMENDTKILYDSISFLENNEICIRNRQECELITIHSIKKFAYTFEQDLYYIASKDRYQNYVFVLDNTMEEVRLK